ncbi:MAG: selenoneine synthase SenA [Burkholderiales bacterium]
MLPIADPVILRRDLLACRERSARITADLEGERLRGPKLAIVNPPLWEVGHLGWFQERWCLRLLADGSLADSILPHADALYDSATVAHDTRWDLPLQDIRATRAYLAQVLERVLERLQREPENATLQYFVRLATFHEDMHGEAFHYTRQTLGYPDPFLPAGDTASAPVADGADIEFAGGTFALGASARDGFVFDNEKWAHEVRIAPFRIARTAVTNAQFLAFVEEAGYARREFWSDQGWSWRQEGRAHAPCYWRREGDAWLERRFDRWLPLRPALPVIHVSWHEAEAYCRFAKRRLPPEAEWEYAAAWDAAGRRKRRYPWGDEAPRPGRANLEGAATVAVGAHADGDSASGCRQMMGNVWEWTASVFEPYPGFVIDPYQEYSEPWFGTHRVLRGGSFSTPARLMRNTWRNFYTPDRGDVFAGFRTCAPI